MKSAHPLKKRELKEYIKNTILVILGTFLLAFGTGIFVIPFDLVTGGVSGIGIILNRLLEGVGFLGELGTEFYASAVNWILFFVGLIFLGKEFAGKTLVSTIVYPFALSLAVNITKSEIIGDYLNLANYTSHGETGVILATVFSGAAIGAGCALTFLGGGSTGGIDIIALTICKYWKKGKSSVLIFICDAIIIIAGMFVINNFVLSLLGIVSAFICAIAIDKMFIGESGAFIAYIVSDKYEEINRAVIRRLVRTTTMISAVGGYSHEPKVMLTVTFGRNQYAEFTAIMSSIDKNAFVTVHRAHEIGGEGWTKYDDPQVDYDALEGHLSAKGMGAEVDTPTDTDSTDPVSN